MTPLAALDLIGIEPPRFPPLPHLPESVATLKAVEVAYVVRESILDDFRQVPELGLESLRWRVETLREATDPNALELFDLCLSRFICRDTAAEEILELLAYDALLTFRFPVEYRARMSHLSKSFLLLNKMPISGLTQVRRLKRIWDGALERILKRHPRARGEILAIDQEMRPRTYRDFLEWELIHHAVLGFGRKHLHPVIAFSPEPEEKLRARCRAHKTALRAFLDEIDPEELRNALRPLLKAWTPGWLVSCREDGTVEGAFSTGEIGVWAGPSRW